MTRVRLAKGLAPALALSLATSTALGQTVTQAPPETPPTATATPALQAPWATPDDPMPTVTRTAPRRRSLAVAQPLSASDPVRSDRASRVIIEGLGGFGLGLGGALLGGLTGLLLAGGSDSGFISDSVVYAAMGASLGFFVGVPMGVVLSGGARGGDGGAGWTVLGMLGGTLTAGLLSYGLSNVSSSGSAGLGTLLGLADLTLIVGGAVLGYELSCTPAGPRSTTRESRAPRFAPTLSLGNGQGAVGLVGAF